MTHQKSKPLYEIHPARQAYSNKNPQNLSGWIQQRSLLTQTLVQAGSLSRAPLLHVAIQQSRMFWYYDAAITINGFLVSQQANRELALHTPASKCFNPEVTNTISNHSPLAWTTHKTLTNYKGDCKMGEKNDYLVSRKCLCNSPHLNTHKTILLQGGSFKLPSNHCIQL